MRPRFSGRAPAGRAMMFAVYTTLEAGRFGTPPVLCDATVLEKRMRNRGALLCGALVALTSMAMPPFVEAQSPAARVQVQLAASPGSGREAETLVQLEL